MAMLLRIMTGAAPDNAKSPALAAQGLDHVGDQAAGDRLKIVTMP